MTTQKIEIVSHLVWLGYFQDIWSQAAHPLKMTHTHTHTHTQITLTEPTAVINS
jgi:hypothetical protein